MITLLPVQNNCIYYIVVVYYGAGGKMKILKVLILILFSITAISAAILLFTGADFNSIAGYIVCFSGLPAGILIIVVAALESKQRKQQKN